ncbi:hypothetical protein GCM10017673_19720 [Streptosporangium violaceochromogenes]|nr:hypothetical protein GCM10017673_19720 [Streptosporangium violaceochromogenes]
MIFMKAAAAMALAVPAAVSLVFAQAPASAGGAPAGPLASCWSHTNTAGTVGYGGCTIVEGWERWRLGVKCSNRRTNYYTPWQYSSLTKSHSCPPGGRVSGVWTDSQS